MYTVRSPKGVEHVQALVRAFSLLEIIARNPAGISLKDLSRSAGLHKSTAFRMLRTMAVLGYVAQIAENKLYCLGHRLPGVPTRTAQDANL
jgi:IclR family acetate operon transcriptional repressor